MSERGSANAARSVMTKPPRTPPSSTGAPRMPAQAPRSGVAAPPVDAPDSGNPFASLSGEPDGATKAFEVPRELIELARAKAAEPASSKGTLTPIAPRPNAELEATLAAYTAGLGSTRAPSSQPTRSEPTSRQEVETLRSHTVATHEESGTVLRRDAPRPSGPAQIERKQLLRSPVAPRPAASHRPVASGSPVASRSLVSPRSTPAAKVPGVTPATPSRRLPWLFYVGLCLILGYCAHLLLSS